jgi:SepF-like predicted cell division protein (DUF552 family)
MNWIKEHYIDVFAAIGALYTAARLIVALTPTKKDDEALEKVGIWLKAIAKIFGLDLNLNGKDKKN